MDPQLFVWIVARATGVAAYIALCLSILSRCAVELEVAAGRLRIVPIEGVRIERAISLLSRRDHRLPRVAQAFLEMIRPQALTRPQSDAIITAS